MNTNKPQETAALFSPFWPVFILALSLTVYLGWQVTSAAQQYVELLRMGDRQAALSEQATQAEKNQLAMMMDLIKLSQSDPAARAIVLKYGIKYNPPANAGSEATTKPTSKEKAQKTNAEDRGE